MKTPLELLEEIRKDFVEKHDGDPNINRICKTVIGEFKSREKQLMKDEIWKIVGEHTAGVRKAKTLYDLSLITEKTNKELNDLFSPYGSKT